MGFFISKIEDYEVLDKIGRGKYSQVYSGIQFKTNQKVALKILKPSWIKSQQKKVPKRSRYAACFKRYWICPSHSGPD